MFLHATMLAGLAGALVPLALHLLSRARYRSVEWGAMMFICRPDGRQHSRSRLREISLLVLRMGIVALLAIALSRPVLSWAGGAQNQPECMVILLDRSASMGLDENGLLRIDAARRAALSALSSLRPGDQAGVIFMPENPGPQAQTPQLSSDFQLLALSISNARPAPGRADIARSLSAAAKLLQASSALHRQVVLVCDRQDTSWTRVDEAFARTWGRTFTSQPSAAHPHLTVIPIGGEDTANIAVESVQVVNPPVIRDATTEIEVHIRNYDSAPSAGLPLTVSVGDRELYRTSLNVPGGIVKSVRFAVTFSSAGPQVLSARIGPSGGLSSDDSMECALEVTDPIGVLVVTGDERTGTDRGPGSVLRSDADFLKLALAPFTVAGKSGPDPARVQVVSLDAWPQLDRNKDQVLVLANVPRLSPLQSRQIEQYVYGGGGLLFVPGPLTRVEDYNSQLWRDGTGVLPAQLEAPSDADGLQATSILGLELSHPVFRFLQGRQDPLPAITVGRYFPAHGQESHGRVLGEYATGRPFLIEGAFGRGRVMLVTTSLDAEWSTLPLSNLYLPFVQSTMRYLAAGVMPDRNLSVGEPILTEINDVADPLVTIEGPSLRPTPLDALRSGDGYEFRWTNTFRPGTYTVHVASGRTQQQPTEVRRMLFVVRPPRDDSDLTSLAPERWDWLQTRLELEPISSEPAAIASAMAQVRRRPELWPFLLPAVIALMIAEIALARAWTADVEDLP